MKRIARCGLLALIALLASCGYHVAGKAVRLPPDLHTVAVPTFANQSTSFRMEQLVTGAVVHELTSRTGYRVINSKDPSADATLEGVVLGSEIAPVTYDSQTGRASSALVTVTARVRLVDRNGTVLFDNPNYTFRDQYQISAELDSFFEEDSAAMQRISRDLARTLVSNILEAF